MSTSWHRIDHIPFGTKCDTATCNNLAAWVIDGKEHRIVLCHECRDQVKRRSEEWAERIARDIEIWEGGQQ